MPIRAFIFDLDGVLVDTAEYHFRAWKQLADEEGVYFNRDDNEALRGLSRRESLKVLLKGRPISDEQAEQWMARKNHYYLKMVQQITQEEILPGARELLAGLRAAGIKIAIASASKNAGEVIDRLDLRKDIDVLCDGYSAERAKPAPDLFLVAAERLRVSPGECVVVEDAAAGIEAARAAGMRTIGLGPPERVGEADLLLPDLSGAMLNDLLSALDALPKKIGQQGTWSK